MKKLLLLLTLLCFLFSIPSISHAQKKSSSSKSYNSKTVRVKSYATKKGKRVKSHYRSKPSRRSSSYIISPTAVTRERLIA